MEELRAQAEALGIKVDKRWGEAKLLQVIADASDVPAVEEIPQPTPNESAQDRIEDMNAYALRIWEGQSPDNPHHWRVERVKAGLTAQGWGDILEHLSLPNG